MPMPRGIWMDHAMREALREYAWNHRTHMGSVLRAAIEDVGSNPGNDSVLSDDDSKSEVRVNVKVEDHIWNSAVNAARKSGNSMNSLVRRRVRKVLREEGLIA